MQIEFTAQLLHFIIAVADNGQQQMFRTDIIVLHIFGKFGRTAENAHHFRTHAQTTLAFNARNFFEHLFQFRLEHRQVDSAFTENSGKQTFRFFNERSQNMRRSYFLMITKRCFLLSGLHGFENFLRIFFFTHEEFLQS